MAITRAKRVPSFVEPNLPAGYWAEEQQRGQSFATYYGRLRVKNTTFDLWFAHGHTLYCCWAASIGGGVFSYFYFRPHDDSGDGWDRVAGQCDDFHTLADFRREVMPAARRVFLDDGFNLSFSEE